MLRTSLAFGLLLLLTNCSREKDLFTARLYHEMLTQYNIVFNGEQALLKACKSLKSSTELKFDSLLPVFINGSAKSVSSVRPDLEKAVSKGNKAILRHSMVIQGQQKNDVIDDSYLLIGKARYFNREYLQALETLNYLIQEFPRSEAAMEARIWAGRTETALGNYLNAKDRFEAIYRDRDLPNKLRDDAYAAYAELALAQHEHQDAFQLLQQALEEAKDKEVKVRWHYLSAQLLAKMGNDYEASRRFAKVVKMGPPYEYLFNAKLSQARNIDVGLQSPQEAYEALRKMLEDGKNRDHRDIIYYTMAEVADKLDDEEQVVHFLNRSVRTSTSNARQKGLSYLWLAQINFQEKQYERAQAYYDSTYQNLPRSHPSYERVEALKESLDKLVANLKTIALQDSLLALSKMGKEQRKEIVEGIIRQKKAEAEAQKRAEQEDQMDQLAFQSGPGRDGPGNLPGMGGGAQKFYFYSPQLRSAGVSQFVERWGNRKLEDHWRRKDKSINPNAPQPGADPAQADGGEAEGEETPPEFQMDTYLAQVPMTDSAKAASHQEIRDAFLENGLLYQEEIQDYLATIKTYEELLERYPDYEDKVKVWYGLYVSHKANDNEQAAERYKNLILQNHPDSKYAYLIKNDGKSPEPPDLKKVRLAYEEAYEAYANKRYSSARQQAKNGFEQYPQTKYGPMFLLLQALAEGYRGDEKAYRELLNKVVKRFPDSEQAAKADELLSQLPASEEQQGNQVKEQGKYKQDFSSMHRYVVLFPQKRADANKISIALANFNQRYFPNDQLRVKTIMMGTDKSLISVSGLANRDRAKRYLSTLVNEKALEKELISVNFQQFVISNVNFSNFYRSQDVSGYKKFYQKYYTSEGK
ncbi:MAG: tetratricopeptide repeat protein [Schleiferiaceae bacterium]|nr:tetratricopeptide repeat protein [Schleiferiaceae bacterium]